MQQKINEEYYSRFPNIQFVCEVDAKRGKNIEELVKILSKIAVGQPRMGEMIPKSYLLLEEKVLKERKRRTKSKVSVVDCRIFSKTKKFDNFLKK